MASAGGSSSSRGDNEPRGRPDGPQKKRKAQKETWKKNVLKNKRVSGEEYVSRATNKVVPARRVGEPCTCPKACFVLLGEEAVQQIFTRVLRHKMP